MGEKSQSTNLASEFYVLSLLYRKGFNAHLTLGNKKSVDIVVEIDEKIKTIDVKGLLDKSLFPLDNWTNSDKNHFIVFVSFLKKMNDLTIIPECYVVPAADILKKQKELDGESLLYQNPKGNRKGVQYCKLNKLRNKYLNNFDLL